MSKEAWLCIVAIVLGCLLIRGACSDARRDLESQLEVETTETDPGLPPMSNGAD